MITAGNINVLWARVLVDELARNGLRDVVVSPGSRSTPLVLAFAEHPDIRDFNLIDERTAAFFALGLIRSTRRPVAVLCTSGTATANYFPAICEADASNLPLLILTADRPAELQDVGASQAMNQSQLYGNKVRWFHQVAQPEALDSKLRYVRSTACKALHRANNLKGPIHLNLPFRKPLEDTQVAPTHPDATNNLKGTELGLLGESGGQPFVAQIVGEPNTEGDSNLDRIWRGASRPVLFAGADSPAQVIEAAARLKLPILAEATSGARQMGCIPEFAVKVLEQAPPDLVLVSGRWAIDWPVIRWLESLPETTCVVWIGNEIEANPNHLAGYRCGSSAFVGLEMRLDDGWRTWIYDHTAKLIERAAESLADAFFDGRVAYELGRIVTAADAVFVSSSMPLRDVELFYDGPAPVFANRGLNGIDGILSTAAGLSAGWLGRTYALVGDVAFQHDMGGLATLAVAGGDFTVVVINNGGGAIFDYLPVADGSEAFRKHFTTPTSVSIEQLCSAFGVAHVQVDTNADLRHALKQPGKHVIELVTDPMYAREVRERYLDVHVEAEELPASTRHKDRVVTILLHGFTGDATTWKALQVLLERETIALDLPGHGRCPVEATSMMDCVVYLKAELDRLGARRCHLVGYSMGGRVACAFAAAYPDQVVSMVTIGATAGIRDDDERQTRREQDLRTATEIRSRGLRVFLEYWLEQPFFSTLKSLGPKWRQASLNQRLSNQTEGLAMALEAYGTGNQDPAWEGLSRLISPTLFLAGELDARYVGLARDLAETTDGDFDVVPSAGHAAHYENPEWVAERINRFWKENA